MIQVSEYSARSKETVIWALAQQDSDFAELYVKYQEKITLNTPLPDELSESVIAVLANESALASMTKHYLKIHNQ